MRGNVSGWYARLDRECEDRIEQMNIWLDAWEEALRTHQPQASQLPSDWPTLPASLLTDPGHVLDHLLCRHDAESDGRSPRGAHPTPTRLADAIIADELRADVSLNGSEPLLTNVNLAALPPAFRAQAEVINDKKDAAREAEVDEEKKSPSSPLAFDDNQGRLVELREGGVVAIALGDDRVLHLWHSLLLLHSSCVLLRGRC